MAAVGAAVRHPSTSGLVPVAVLLALAVLDAELGRHAEGGKVLQQRAHKGLSAWPFAAVALCPSTLAILITVPTYAYVRWRGMRVPLFKWVGSAALVSLAAAAAQPLLPSLSSPGAGTLPRLVAGGLLFLAVEAGCFAGCALLGEPEDEKWLKAELRRPGYYANEAFVLCQAAVIAIVWSANPLLVVLLLPSYAVLQRALLHRTLREAAETDAKTGLLFLHAWEQRARAVLAKGHTFSVLLVDLDHFKRVNDEYGHLTGDDVLAESAARLRSVLRPHDLLGRFGGEEFVVLLPDADVAEAQGVAERLRVALQSTPIAGIVITASVGLYASDAVEPDRLREALTCADVALLTAKREGRNNVRCYRPLVPEQRPAPVFLPQ